MIFNTCSLFNIPPFGSLPEAWKGLFAEGSCESRPKGIHLMESFLFIYRLGNDFDSSKSQLSGGLFEIWKSFIPRRELRKQTQRCPFDGVFFIYRLGNDFDY